MGSANIPIPPPKKTEGEIALIKQVMTVIQRVLGVTMKIAIIVLECSKETPEADEELEQLKARSLSRLKHWRLEHSVVLQAPAE